MNTVTKIILAIISIPTILSLFSYLFLEKKILNNIETPKATFTSGGLKFE